MRFFKSIPFFLLLLWVFTSLFSGCDKIDPPYTTGDDHEPNGDHGEVVQRVLLEEFTGHQCPNCPEGSKIASQLKTHYGDQLVIIAIHAGWFANTDDDLFSYDFTTSEGDALESHFQVNQFPVGMVNRSPFDGNMLLSPSAWGEAMHAIMHDQPRFFIAVNPYHHGEGLDVHVEVTALEACGRDYHLSVFLTESGIIKPQKVNDPEYPSGVVEDYEHNHVLRTGLNGTWGDLLNEENIAAGMLFEHDYHISWDDEWVPENSAVVVFIYDAETEEVMQVTEAAVLS